MPGPDNVPVILNNTLRDSRLANFFGFPRATFENHFRPGSICGFMLVAGFQLCLVPHSMAGPPLVTDDPGILDPGVWEIIIAIAGEDHPAGNDIHAPILDISLGVSDSTQLSFLLPHLVVKPEKSSRKTGFGYASVGYKWRFISTPGWDWAIAANYTLPVSHEIIRANGPEDTRVLGLPLLVSHSHGNWIWNGQLGWNIGNDGTSFWDYGLAVSHPWGNSLQWMVEVFGNATSSFEQSTLNYQVGLDYEINPALHLLTSAGSRIKSRPERGSRLNYSFYLGLQWFH